MRLTLRRQSYSTSQDLLLQSARKPPTAELRMETDARMFMRPLLSIALLRIALLSIAHA